MRRRMLWPWGASLLAAAVVLGAVVVFGFPSASPFDTWWNEFMTAHRADALVQAALVLNAIGGGWIAVYLVPLGVIAAFLLARRRRSAVFAALCFVASAGMVQVLKQVFARARPDDMIVVSDFGSFPSGHTANAATIALVVWILFPRVWTAIAGALWVVAMALSRTVLSVHWATDTIGGALIGAAVVLLLADWLLPWVQAVRPSDPTPRSAG
ncbi:phosphatase PAP2 family protein [Microbacterium sp.]|uniref:phosphatase PAP2 family protein n=1 Tax=Microbacterium sp. TaxID=51671 RepID=UPI0039E50AD4